MFHFNYIQSNVFQILISFRLHESHLTVYEVIDRGFPESYVHKEVSRQIKYSPHGYRTLTCVTTQVDI